MKREEGKEKREEGRVHETERLALAVGFRCARGGRVAIMFLKNSSSSKILLYLQTKRTSDATNQNFLNPDVAALASGFGTTEDI